MSENKQPFDQQEENTGSVTAQPDVRSAGTRMRVAYAAIAGATVGAVVSAVAAAFTGKGVSDGVKAVVEGAVDTVKRTAEGVKSTVVEGAVETVKQASGGVQPTKEDTSDTVKAATEDVQPTGEDAFDAAKAATENVQPTEEDPQDAVKTAIEGIKFTVKDTLDTVKAATEEIKFTVKDTLDTVKAAAEEIKFTVEGDVTTVHGGHDASQVSASVKKEGVVEQPPHVDADWLVASGKADFPKEKVARMEVEEETAETPNLITDGMRLDEPSSIHNLQMKQERIQLLEKIENSSPFKATHSVADGTTPAVANNVTPNVGNDATSSAALVQLLLSQVGTEMAMSYYEQLPVVLFTEIQRLATNPSLEEKQRIRDSWAKALEPLALAIVRSGQSFDVNTALATSNGHHKPVNQLKGSSDHHL